MFTKAATCILDKKHNQSDLRTPIQVEKYIGASVRGCESLLDIFSKGSVFSIQHTLEIS